MRLIAGREKWTAIFVNIRILRMLARPLNLSYFIFRALNFYICTYKKLLGGGEQDSLASSKISSLHLKETSPDSLLLVDSHSKRTLLIKKVETRERLSSTLLNIMMILIKITHTQCSNMFPARINIHPMVKKWLSNASMQVSVVQDRFEIKISFSS